MPSPIIIDETGIRVPDYGEILADLQSSYRNIYGEDVYLGNDSQDGQLLAVFASAINDAYAAVVAAYNAFSPSTAQGLGLSRVVRINGLERLLPTNSTADVLLVGQAGATIENGRVGDGVNSWALPTPVVIPPAGEITVTATAETSGAISAAANSINRILTPQFGWQSVNNPSAGSVGAPRESDASLRRRQARSTMIPSRTVLDGLGGALLSLAGVTRVKMYENDTNSTNADGMVAKSIAVVVTGGDATEIAQTILNKKTPGCATLGDVETVLYSSSVPTTIRFWRPIFVDLAVELAVTALPGYSTSIGLLLRQKVVDYINGLGEGEDVLLGKLYGISNLEGAPEAATYNVTAIEQAIKPAALDAVNITIAYTSRARIALADVTLVVS
jgi:uncharacterized phage protein gp47/JayE